MTTAQERVERFAKFAAAKTLHQASTSEHLEADPLAGSTYFATEPHGTEAEQDIVERAVVYSAQVRAASVIVEVEFPTIASTSDLRVEQQDIRVSQSPFEELFDLHTNDERIDDLLEYIQETLDVSFKQRLVRRLGSLREIAR